MSRRPVLAISTVAALGVATLISATPAAAAPVTYTNDGVQLTYCKEVTNARKGAATIFVDAVNTNVASSTDSGIRTVGAAINRPKGSKSTRIVARWDATVAPTQAASGSLKAQSGDTFAIGVGRVAGGGAGETLDLADVPTC